MSTQTMMSPEEFEEQFKCCICLHVHSDPVSIVCGHNFCLDCIEGYWDSRGRWECPLCKRTFKKRPELRINREFADIIDFIKRSLRAAREDGGVDAVAPERRHETNKVPCDICLGHKATAVKSCLACQASYCETHLAPHGKVAALQRHRLTDPATFSSRHLCRIHDEPLTMFCKKEQMPLCASCSEGKHQHHQVVPLEKESRRTKSHLRATKVNVVQMIQAQLGKMEEITNSLDLSKKVTERELQSGAQVCSKLIAAVLRQQAELVEELERRQEEAEQKAEQLLAELEQELDELRTKGGELQHLELTQNTLDLLQGFQTLGALPPSRDWSQVSVCSDHSAGTVRRAVGRLVGVCQEAADVLSAEEVDRMSRYAGVFSLLPQPGSTCIIWTVGSLTLFFVSAVDVTLDPDTASGWLLLSADGKKVSVSGQRTPLPSSPQRFDTCVCVLGKRSFTCGRRYWEVEVGHKSEWDLGVARESINRKGVITVRPDSGYWAICRRNGGSLSACVSPSVPLPLQETPRRVAIFLDYEDGSVSFYDAEAKTHIYTFSGCSFTEPLLPYFNPCLQDNGRNAAPLVICPLARGK
uniref:E3 ubiquitin-protein ligase TRIM39-like n=1 Tax=Scophthalmus maximus TaxID=52904 RepID=A0A8D3DVC2_SCOMX